ncbi:DUF6765 family protein [Halodesulfovibrio sp.]|jgi:hypothetical protein|uniref:DUF6765 family protein n=1 Tax=Halodesulfovibrio sp. TaxID=1912772 RepID=UPI0025EDC4B6|nr:DUF6765 family protein [Halodesulfovibrio sp.]MCT4535454.1 hypothetical protein [Halodesulfovibrio sp.]
MQIDMHYYGTYTLARAAGLNQETAELVATASQFVDDNVESSSICFADGGQMSITPTGHHFQQTAHCSTDAQRNIWIPFHFLPGASGDTFTERLICKKNSATTAEMAVHHLLLADTTFAPMLMGIAAHVIADTFSHHNFSGASSQHNQITQETITIHEPVTEVETLDSERTHFLDKFEYIQPDIQAAQTTAALGHGAAASFPDIPYLTWSYQPAAQGEKIRRHNPDDFMEAAEALYSLFIQFAERRQDLSDPHPVPFETIQDSIAIIFASPGNKHQRSGYWQLAMEQGAFLQGRQEEIPPYQGQMWKNRCEELASCPDCALITELDIVKFYQAASIHKTYVLQQLFPAHDISVI